MRSITSLPSLGSSFLRALRPKRVALPVAELPALKTRLSGFTLREEDIGPYRAVCGLEAQVPLAYLHRVATPIHIAMVTDASFPLRAMGLVHPRAHIDQLRPLKLGDQVDLTCSIEGLREVKSGLEFDLLAEATVGGEPVWRSVAATLYRTRGPAGGSEDAEIPAGSDQPMPFAADAGRRYARVSGDYNPVHIHPLTSRLFGHPRPIAHGWYTLARLTRSVGLDLAGPARLDLTFRRPVRLPSKPTLRTWEEADGGRGVALIDERGKVLVRGVGGPIS